MKNILVLATIVISTLAFTTLSRAQETQVNIDREGKLESIDSEVEKKLGLFTAYKNFREARLFQVSDTSFVLEISYQSADKPLKVRFPMSNKETAEFRDKVSKRIAEQAPQVILNQEGRTKLIVGSALLSLGYYGWAVPVISEVEDGKTAVALYMLTSGAGFFIPLAATSNIAVTDAAASLYLYGGTRGIIHGIFLNRLFVGEESSARGLITFGMLGSIAEAIAGFAVAHNSMMHPGTASTIGVVGDFGLGLGIGTAVIADLFEAKQANAAAASILLGSSAGLLAGNWLAKDQPYTRGDSYVLQSVGLLGAYIPVALLDIAGVKEAKTYTAVSMAGSVLGLGLGHQWAVRGKDFTTGQGVLIQLGEFSGGLVGLGFAYLLSPSKGGNGTLFLTSSALGALAGFALTYSAFAQDARAREETSSWKLNFSPYGLLTSSMVKKGVLSFRVGPPIVSVEYRF